MGELLLVNQNNGVQAVMTKTQYDWVYSSDGTTEDLYQRRNSANIAVFASRRRIRQWYDDQDPRFLGINGTCDDLEAILKRHSFEEKSIYVPFSNGPDCQGELLHHAASWETFRAVFGPEDWTFKFGQKPDWFFDQPDNSWIAEDASLRGNPLHNLVF
jgi:hypothetical protein